MAVRFSVVSLILLATTSLCAIAAPKQPGRPWDPSSGGGGCSCSSNAPLPPSPKVIIVGGRKDQWSFGINYTKWAMNGGTFYVDDVLQFNYPLPVTGGFFNHSVHLLKDLASFQSCNLSGSVRVGNEYAGGTPDGFKFQLGVKLTQPYFFACGEKNGLHCNIGTMKFAVWPIPRPGSGSGSGSGSGWGWGGGN